MTSLLILGEVVIQEIKGIEIEIMAGRAFEKLYQSYLDDHDGGSQYHFPRPAWYYGKSSKQYIGVWW